ncbi:MAG TPA: hypothetical protein VK604_01855 [Bryobacteraceae bacterium]|nr:hypothetical protein [Bryobacteraceae bacterium]
MNLFVRLGAIPTMALFAGFCLAQEPSPSNAQSAPPQSAPSQPPAPAQSTPGMPTQVERQKKPPVEPRIIEDGGLSIEALYWFNRQQPSLNSGFTALAEGDMDYSGNAKYAPGLELAVPAGRSNTLRLSYFRVQGNSNSTLSAPQTFFNQPYDTGDYLAAGYRLQAAKVSWDYLSYTWYRPSTKIRFKTLYELQYININSTITAPFKPQTTDASGNVTTNIATGSKTLFLPSIGGEFEAELGKHFRWEVKASGFGLPHRSAVGDAQALLAIKVTHNLELIGGERLFYFKTSPKGDVYFRDRLLGAFVGVRYYWGRQQ